MAPEHDVGLEVFRPERLVDRALAPVEETEAPAEEETPAEEAEAPAEEEAEASSAETWNSDVDPWADN